MFKKLFSCLGIAAFLCMLVPSSTSAATDETVIQNLVLKIDGESAATFNPVAKTVQITFDLSETADIDAYVFNSSYQNVATLATAVSTSAGAVTLSTLWYGREGNSPTGAVLPDGTYSVYVSAKIGTEIKDSDSKNIAIEASASSAFTLSAFTLSTALGGTTFTSFDPAPLGSNEILTVNYTLSQAADDVSVIIKNSRETIVDNFSATTAQKTTGSFTWNGQHGLKLVDPGIYTATLTAAKSGYTNIADTKTFTVAYNHSSRPQIQNFTISPTAFDPDAEDAIIAFQPTHDASVIVEIQDATYTKVRGFTGYEHDSKTGGTTYTVAWNGKNSSGADVSIGNYNVMVRTESAYGVSVERQAVAVNNSGGSVPAYNAHIKDISFSPSKFEPAEDDELRIRFDVKVDLDELKIYATRGTQEIEIYNEDDTDQESNVEVYWDGTSGDDDDEYVDQGSWRILFVSKVGTTELRAGKTVEVKYDKPGIDDIYMSKTKFDNELGEFTNILFRVDMAAEVDIVVLLDNVEDEFITEEMEVEEDKWYAVEWDASGYDYEDSLDIKVIAKNRANSNVYDWQKEDVDLAEDDVASSKSNVTGDYISPVITEGDSQMTLYYDLEDTADLTITIHRGTSASGTKIIELLNVQDQAAGTHEIVWNGRNSSGNVLSKGIYTYKIISKKNSTDTETGYFIVGELGGIEGTASDGGSTSDYNGGSVSPHVVIVDGETYDEEDAYGYEGETSDCGGFSDITYNSIYCDAVDWAEEEGVFEGYSDGSFKPYQPINRVELLKIILEAMDINILPPDGTALGFRDVDVWAWYMPYIRTGQSLGIFQGDAGRFTARPADTVNRAEALKLVFETLRATGIYSPAACAVSYPDVQAGAWYYNYACSAYNFALFDDIYLNPGRLSTRGEMAEALYKLNLAGLQ